MSYWHANYQMPGDVDHVGDAKFHVQEEDCLKMTKEERNARHRPHHCTDWACLFLFIAAWLPFLEILRYSFDNGDMRRLYHGYDFLGQLCGVDENVTEKGMLFWCKKDGVLDLAHPICVENCPVGAMTSHYCYEGKREVREPGTDGHSFTVQSVYQFIDLEDYSTMPWMGRYCYPHGDTALLGTLTSAIESNHALTAINSASELGDAWVPLCISVVVAGILGIVYLMLLAFCAKCFVMIALVLLAGVPLCMGTGLAISYFQGGLDGIPGTGDGNLDLLIAICCFVFGACVILLTCCSARAIDVTVDCIEASCECILACKSLLFEPLFSLAVKLTVTLVMLFGFIWLLSCGQVQHETLEEYALHMQGGTSGIARTFTYTEEEYWAILYYIFMFFWFIELFTALSQFVLAYSVQLWFFCPIDPVKQDKMDVPLCPIPRGYFIGFVYHLGSLALGSFIIAVTRLIRVILAIVTRQAKESGNRAVACCGACCECCLSCFQNFLQFVNKNAYIDMALNSNTFCTSARRALSILTQQLAQVALLQGATWVVDLAGTGFITVAGAYVTWTMLTLLPWFNEEESDLFVPEPISVTVVAGLLCFIVARCFMTVLDIVSDTIFYCYAVAIRRREKGEIPSNIDFVHPHSYLYENMVKYSFPNPHGHDDYDDHHH